MQKAICISHAHTLPSQLVRTLRAIRHCMSNCDGDSADIEPGWGDKIVGT